MLKGNNRRNFLRNIALGSLGVMWADNLIADPFRLLLNDYSPLVPVKIMGKVASSGKGIGGVLISDGLNVTQTGVNGEYELISSSERPFVWITIPSGHQIPVRSNNVSSFYRSLVAGKTEFNFTWNLDKMEEDDSHHGFLLVSDPQTENADDMLRYQSETIPDIIESVNHNNVPLFNLSCGDIMWDNLELYKDFEKGLNKVGLPGFQVVGNHDLDKASNDVASVETFMSLFGPNYYSFNRGEVHYVVLDDVYWHGTGYLGYLDEIQLKWLENDLAFIEKGRRVIVFTHIPVYNLAHVRNGSPVPRNRVVVANRDRLYRILEKHDVHIITGHTHVNDHFSDGGATHHNCGTACGAWWTADICSDGTPNGYVVYDIKGTEIRRKYKSTRKATDHQMRLYEKGVGDERKVIANVWDADSNWKINIYEDGIQAGRMRQFTGLDPKAELLFSGGDKPSKRSWVEPSMTSHLFSFRIATKTSKVIIEAIDSSGNIYKEGLITTM